jgi:hypothetical protein
MFVNIISFIIILITLVLILNYSKGYKESFSNFPDSKHNSYVTDSQTKFNPLTNTINLLDPAFPITPDSSNTFKQALNVLEAKPTPEGYNLESKSEFNLPSSSPGIFKSTESCESRTTDCGAFDDPIFAANCGISFDTKGETSTGKTKAGGRFISTADRKEQLERAAKVLETGGAPYDPFKVYQPTLGTSKPGTFALNKEQCVVVKERTECSAKQTFSSPNCSQCYTSRTFSRVDPTSGRLPFNIFFVGNGSITVAPTNNDKRSSLSLNDITLDRVNPVTMPVVGNSEGTLFSINVTTSDGSMPWVAGCVSGQTPRGEFKLDLMTLIEKDNATSKRPKINGTANVNGFKSMVMIPGSSSGTAAKLSLTGMIPFTFLSVYDSDALNCDNGPIITQAASATFLESDPCFAKSNKPGSYSLECLQGRWLELGGTQQGTGYPANDAAAAALQIGTNGTPLTIDAIVDNLAPKIASALSGVSANGQPLSINEWNSLSTWATGKAISTPCDAPNSATGPLSRECLSYLYLNQGASSHIGATYTLLPSQVASMKAVNSGITYCQPGAPLDPTTEEGLKKGQSLGGVGAVKEYYDKVNRLANDNTQKNTARADAIKQCYGVNLDTPSASSSGDKYTLTPGGYHETTGPQTCFAGLSLEVAKQRCNDMGKNCVNFSYAVDGSGSGCFKGNVAGGFVNTTKHVGYLKL